jgi:RNA polymerase sigma-70 factor (ECF subfamily)
LAKRVLARHEDAEEVVQDVFAYVWREAVRYEASRASVAGWLVMLTRTRAIDKLRSRQARPDLNQAADPRRSSMPASASPILNHWPCRMTTRDALGLTALPVEQRSLIDLAY